MITSPNADAVISASYEAYDCQVNRQTVDQVFAKYHESGFLYPGKLKQLEPYWELIKRNWQIALRGGEILMFEVSTRSPDAWASLSSWRHTNNSWVTQHLASLGGPKAARDVMLAAQAIRFHDNIHLSHQNWFQPTNRFANRVFGGMVQHLSPEHFWLGEYAYSIVPIEIATSLPLDDGLKIEEATGNDCAELCRLATQARSEVYAVAEELNSDDLQLNHADFLYRQVGLRRYRQLQLCRNRSSGQLLGMAVAYRGPLGLNFSFLENRCDLILPPRLNPLQKNAVAQALLRAVVPSYACIPIQAIPVISERQFLTQLEVCSQYFVRNYSQSIWLRDGFEAWYRYVESVFKRIASRRDNVE